MKIECVPLAEVSKVDVMELMNHPKVRTHLPLLKGEFGETEYQSFLADKQKIWEEYGYGPSAFTVEGQFIGWGGLQPLDEDVEVALVLHPSAWGAGKTLFRRILQDAFQTHNLASVVILLPPSRTRIRAMLKFGFQPDGDCFFAGHPYIRYRLHKKAWSGP